MLAQGKSGIIKVHQRGNSYDPVSTWIILQSIQTGNGNEHWTQFSQAIKSGSTSPLK